MKNSWFHTKQRMVSGEQPTPHQSAITLSRCNASALKPLGMLCGALLAWAFWPASAYAQAQPGIEPIVTNGSLIAPTYWYLLAAAIAFLMPVGFVLIGVAGVDPEHAWNAALGGLAAVGLATFSYWAIGFALQFGGIGLVYPQPALKQLVWEWSPLSMNWGIGWGVAGLSGWFLSGPNVTALAYALFMAHLPWVITAAILPIMALRGRAPATATLLLALLIGGILYPLGGNWVQGGGWLSALGRNLNLGHGFVDFGGAGTVHLVGAGFAFAGMVMWVPRRPRQPLQHLEMPPVHLPLLVVAGSLLVLAGSIGWQWANPLQVSLLGDLALMRGSVNCVLVAAGGLIPPLIYTWFVTGRSDPLICARGLVAGVVAGQAVGPFVQPGIAFAIGFIAGATIPFVIFIIEGIWRLDDATGVLTSSGVPAAVGLLLVGLFADGAVGAGWQMSGLESYLGVLGQGVSGLFVINGYQLDFPRQLQAQGIGVLALGLWGFLVGMICCTPLALLFHALEHSESRPSTTAIQPVLSEPQFDLGPIGEEWPTVVRRERRERR